MHVVPFAPRRFVDRSAGVRVLDAVVLAGGPPDAVAALEPGAPNKAFVRVGGTALVTRTIAGLRASSRIDRIVAVAPPAAAAHPALAGASEVRGDGPRMVDSLRSGLAGFVGDGLVLIAAADLAALDGPAVDEFVDAVLAREVDLAYACLERRHHLAAYPEFPHTWARLREGRFCGGGVVALRPRVLPQLALLLDALGDARKSPLRLAGLFGWDVLLRFALGRLSIAQAEARGSRLIGGARRGDPLHAPADRAQRRPRRGRRQGERALRPLAADRHDDVQEPRYGSEPFLARYVASSTRERIPSLAKTAPRWCSTVRSLSESCSPISRLESPVTPSRRPAPRAW